MGFWDGVFGGVTVEVKVWFIFFFIFGVRFL